MRNRNYQIHAVFQIFVVVSFGITQKCDYYQIFYFDSIKSHDYVSQLKIPFALNYLNFLYKCSTNFADLLLLTLKGKKRCIFMLFLLFFLYSRHLTRVILPSNVVLPRSHTAPECLSIPSYNLTECKRSEKRYLFQESKDIIIFLMLLCTTFDCNLFNSVQFLSVCAFFFILTLHFLLLFRRRRRYCCCCCFKTHKI